MIIEPNLDPTDCESALRALGITFNVVEHAEALTCDTAAAATGHIVSDGVKSIVLRDKKNTLAMCVLRGNYSLNFKEVATVLSLRRPSMAPPIVLQDSMARQPGEVSPLDARRVDVALIAADLDTSEVVFITSGAATRTVSLKGEDLVRAIRLCTPRVLVLPAEAWSSHNSDQ